MQKAITWCLAGIIIGAGAYIVIDRLATPRAPGVEYSSAPDTTQTPEGGQSRTGQTQPGQPTPRTGVADATGPSDADGATAVSGDASDGANAEAGFRTDVFDAAPPADPTPARLLDPATDDDGLPRGIPERVREQVAELRDIQAELTAMTNDPAALDVEELDAVLQRLERVGEETGAGIDLSALRSNLNNAVEMMQLSEQVNQAVSDGATPEELEAYVQDLELMQGRMRNERAQGQ